MRRLQRAVELSERRSPPQRNHRFLPALPPVRSEPQRAEARWRGKAAVGGSPRRKQAGHGVRGVCAGRVEGRGREPSGFR